MTEPPGAGRLVALLCLAEVLGMLGFASFPALTPDFLVVWSLTNTEAGTISGIYFAGYMAAVPVLVSLTDRVDARRIYLGCTVLAGLSFLGFALLANGFWSALFFQTLAGVGLAGTYMPGLKLLSDHIPGPRQSRYVSFYTASFSIGAGMSFFVTGEIEGWRDWRWAFAAASAGAFLSALLVFSLVPPGRAEHASRPDTHLLDFRPIWRSRATMMYVLGYAAHLWELFAIRAWVVTFLTFSLSLQSTAAESRALAPTVVAALVNIVGVPASILGNELAMRFGRRRVVMTLMVASTLYACVIGFLAASPYWLVVILCCLYIIPAYGDSAGLTAGTVAAAPDGYRGAAMALHSTFGFGAGFLGIVAVGAVLDAAGGMSVLAWGLAFVTMGLGSAAGSVALAVLGRGIR